LLRSLVLYYLYYKAKVINQKNLAQMIERWDLNLGGGDKRRSTLPLRHTHVSDQVW
jgi:hypothetical protein